MSAAYPWPAYLLAGGRSRRLGEDKARARLDDETTVLQAAMQPLGGLFLSWTALAAEEGAYDDLGVPTLGDETPDRGPLGGILRAAIDCEEEYFFVMSCDRLGVRREWVERLAERLNGHPAAVTFEDRGRREPLFGFYRADLVGELRGFMEGNHGAVWRFLETVDGATIPAPPGWEDCFSVNEPGDLQRARKWWRSKMGDAELTSRGCD